jgi:enediyne biosynthesis protein E3
VASTMRALRRRILTPNVSETKLATRGFHDKGPEARFLLETVGQTFLAGFARAAEARVPDDIERSLDTIEPQFRGFAYEGAGMAFALIDGMSIGPAHRSATFLAGSGEKHIYMAYVGIGWAMARLPRIRWAKASAAATDPLLKWLVLDGYGFHQAYFRTDRYVHGHQEEVNFPWPAEDPTSYAQHAIDQGIGRATWFVAGSNATLAADLIDKFPAHRHQDLYSGAGLAATYAGGGNETELQTFWTRAGQHRPNVAQASAFAAQARIRAGLLVPHTKLATQVFCGMTPQEAAELTDAAIPTGPVNSHEPAFETWRQNIAASFAAHSRL